MSEQQATLVRAERVHGAPDLVFDFLVDPDKMQRWFGTAVKVDPAPGGRFQLSVNGTDAAVGTYQEVDRPHRIVFTWGWEGSSEVPPGSTTVMMTLIGAGDETIIELRHEGLPSLVAADHADGWHQLLKRLAAAVLDHDDGPS